MISLFIIRDFNDKLTKYMFSNDDIKNEHIKHVEKLENEKREELK